MSTTPDADLTRLAERYVWWQPPEVTLRDPRRLLAQILEIGRPEDYETAERAWGRDALKTALLTARRGEIGAKSRHFWLLWFGISDAVAR